MFRSWGQLEIMKGARIPSLFVSADTHGPSVVSIPCMQNMSSWFWASWTAYMRSCWLLLFVKCCILLDILGNNSQNSCRRVIVFLLICFIFEVLEKGSGEDLAVFCRSVISYCEKRGVEVGTTRSVLQLYPGMTGEFNWESDSVFLLCASIELPGSASALLLSSPSLLALT